MRIFRFAAALALGATASLLVLQPPSARAQEEKAAHQRRRKASIRLAIENGQRRHLGLLIREGRKVLFSETVDTSSDSFGFEWLDGYVGHRYEVVVMDTANNIIVSKYVRLPRDFAVVEVPAAPDTPPDPRDQQILALQQQVAVFYNDKLVLRSHDLRVFANATLPATVALVGGSLHGKQAAHTIQTSSSQQLEISSLTYRKDAAAGLRQQNGIVEVDGEQFGLVRTVIGDSDLITFSSSTRKVFPAGTAHSLALSTDILTTTTPGFYPSTFDLVNWTAIDSTTGSSVPFPGEALGQNVQIADGPTLTVTTAGITPPPQTRMMGTTNIPLLNFRTSADSFDDIAKSQVVMEVTIEGGQGQPGFTGFRIRDNTGTLTETTAMVMVMQSATQARVTFSLLQPAITPKDSSLSLLVEGDAATYQSGQSVSGAKYTFTVHASGITARAVDIPTATVMLVGSAQSAPVTLARATLNVTTIPTPPSASGPLHRGGNDGLFTINYSGGGRLDAVTFLLQGGATPSSISTFIVTHIDPGTGSGLGMSSPVTATWDSTKNGWIATFYPQFVTQELSPKAVNFRVNSGNFYNNPSTTDALTVTIIDVKWWDGGATFSLDASYLPILGISTVYE